ncbi:hypothetical protein CJF42_03505 [Pseudoalteromonas sp. NBT06-2]|uniref:hypothetical protein n=1 Tax=Pseudoalteromonas sp. NBT06-2 TaxID=2025950 RepID=UPI000BA58BCB|nr:hypothetical protein [Pseudoalteromonas sp. NBT06-2]PAJ75710.1 hypothetical protein CJF42_03505 [Pseudoalteromonas sp. NBT06-2]
MKILFITTAAKTRACVLDEQPNIDFNSIECGEYSTEIAKDWITDPEQKDLLEFAITEEERFDKVAVVCEYKNYNKTVEKYRSIESRERLAKYPHTHGGEVGERNVNNQESIRRYEREQAPLMEARLQELLNAHDKRMETCNA